MSEPSYEELKARLADLEKQVETKKRSGDLTRAAMRRSIASDSAGCRRIGGLPRKVAA